MKHSKTFAYSVAVSTLTATAALASPAINADVSATAGAVSDYYFRGVHLGDAGAYGSVDFESHGFYAGTWWIDDGAAGGNDGLEHDWYLGYGQEYDSASWSVGYTRYEYTYTSDFEHEVSVGGSIAGFSLTLVAGEDENDIAVDYDYEVYTAGYEYGPVAATVGRYEADDNFGEYDWAEVSFSGELADGISAGLTVGVKSEDAVEDDGYIFLDVSKTFDL